MIRAIRNVINSNMLMEIADIASHMIIAFFWMVVLLTLAATSIGLLQWN